ncbi:MAG: helicase-related protein [Candidatus Bathyarchaeia archaeon]
MNEKHNLNEEVSGQSEPIFNYRVWILNKWYAEFSKHFSYKIKTQYFFFRDKIWRFKGSWANFETLINEELRRLYDIAEEGERQFILDLYKRTAKYFKWLNIKLPPPHVKVVDALSGKSVGDVQIKYDGQRIIVQREGYKGFMGIVKDEAIIKIMPIQADVIIKATLVDDLGDIGPHSHLLIEVKPVSYRGENIKSITNENGMARLKLLFNQEYELSYSHENATYNMRVLIDSLYKEIEIKPKTSAYHRLRVNICPETRSLFDFIINDKTAHLLIILYDLEGNLIAKGYTGEIIDVGKHLKPGLQIIAHIYPIDPEGRYIEEWHARLKNLTISKGEDTPIPLNKQEINISIPVSHNHSDKHLKTKFKDLDIFRSFSKDIKVFFCREKRPEVVSISFSEYLGWNEKSKVMALFGGKNGEAFCLYRHQFEALRILEESGPKRLCLILASGMASGKTEVAILYLLKIFRKLGAVKPGGHVVVVYPTRELLRNQYARWKTYFNGAYDLGYLSLPVEVVKLYGELATKRPMEYEREKEKLVRSPCIVLTTASTLFGWANKLDSVLNDTVPSVMLFDEIHFYTALDLTLIMELLNFMLNKYGGLNKILMFSATIGGLKEFSANVEDFLGIKTVPIRGESLQGQKATYSINLSEKDDKQQEAVINQILENYARKGFDDKTIIFTRDRNEAESLYDRLSRSFRRMACLHLGDMDELERRKSARDFMLGRRKVIITVKTLEVGIDIGDASRVIHLGLPQSLNDFMQREGRIGRRGQECESIIILRDSGEVKRFNKWIEELGYEPIHL